jgi:murein DD-endopeptidase MepM/ murein hydrolase activator NlpD
VVPVGTDAREHAGMIRARRAPSPVDRGWRLLAPVLITALVLTTGAAEPAAVEARSSDGAAVIRARQLAAEAAMRRADSQIRRLQRERRQHARLLKEAKRKLEAAKQRRDGARQKADRAHARLEVLELDLARKTRVRPNPKGTQAVDKPALRKQLRRLRTTVAKLDRDARTAERRVEKARALKQSRWNRPSKQRIDRRKAERERAEDRLSAAITAMSTIARERSSRLGTASAGRLRRPVAGTVSQRFGCTGYRANPRRGGCRHFHDGVDIAAPKGRKVRAAADGIVTYVGFNPWDAGARAFIVIVTHDRGYESLYAHLKPTRKVRAGQRLERGDVVGTIGLTGTTTGPHVHWELRRGGRIVDPLKASR